MARPMTSRSLSMQTAVSHKETAKVQRRVWQYSTIRSNLPHCPSNSASRFLPVDSFLWLRKFLQLIVEPGSMREGLKVVFIVLPQDAQRNGFSSDEQRHLLLFRRGEYAPRKIDEAVPRLTPRRRNDPRQLSTTGNPPA